MTESREENPGRHASSDPEAGVGTAEMGEASPDQAGWAEAPRTLPEAVKRLEQLATELAQARAEIEQNRDRALRERADLENFKRRMQRDKSEALRYANEGLLRELLPIIDNLERAVRAARDAAGKAPGGGAEGGLPAGLLSGVEMVLSQFHEVLGRFGVTRIPAAAQPFDPSQHEAIAQVETLDQPAGTVVDEHLPGYHLHDRLLRAAQVSVAKAAAKPSTGQPSGRGARGGTD